MELRADDAGGPAECMKRPVVRVASPAPVPTAAGLDGVRRRPGAVKQTETAADRPVAPMSDGIVKPAR